MEHLPPWLRQVPLPARPSASAAPRDDIPAWLVEDDAPTPSPRATSPALSSPAPAEDVPEWLRDLQSEIDQRVEPSPVPRSDASVNVPEWLRETDDLVDPAQAAARPGGATSWLDKLGEVPPVSPSTPTAPESPTTTNSRIRMPVGATDWLRSIGEESDPREPVLLPQEPEQVAGDEVPDWLRDVSPDELQDQIAASDSEHGVSPDAEVPSWLLEEAGLGTAQPSARATNADDELALPAIDAAPDWLSGLTREEQPRVGAPSWLSADDAAESSDAPDEDVPDWLREVAGEPPARAASVQGEVPDWLLDEVGVSARSADAVRPNDRDAHVDAAGDEDIPTWLQDAEPAPAARTPEEIPAWLQDAEPAPAARTPEEIPAWLQDAEPAPAARTANDDIPAWLQGMDDEVSPPADHVNPPVVPSIQRDNAAAPAPVDVPPWLMGEQSQAGVADIGLPAWLRGVDVEPIAPQPLPSRPAASASNTISRERAIEDDEGSDFLTGTDLPGWLRPQETEAPVESADSRALEWLSRLGEAENEEENDVLPTAMIAAPAVPFRPVYRPSETQLQAQTLLGGIVRNPYPQPRPIPAPPPRSAWHRLHLDRFLYAVLALLTLLALAVPALTAPFGVVPPSEGANELSALVNSLDADDIVLMGYEWDAQRSSEMRTLERAVVDDLIARNVKLVLVSTDPQGTMLSFDAADRLQAAGYNPEVNGVRLGARDYILLGYRPGGELALRGLAQDLRGALASDFEGRDATVGGLATNIDGTPRLNSLDDLSLVLVLGDQAGDVQAWIEQIHSAANQVPIAFLMPAEVEPIVAPYLRLPNVYYIGGLRGAHAYAALSPVADQAQVAASNRALSFSVVSFLSLLLIGIVVGELVSRRDSKRGAV